VLPPDSCDTHSHSSILPQIALIIVVLTTFQVLIYF